MYSPPLTEIGSSVEQAPYEAVSVYCPAGSSLVENENPPSTVVVVWCPPGSSRTTAPSTGRNVAASYTRPVSIVRLSTSNVPAATGLATLPASDPAYTIASPEIVPTGISTTTDPP